MGKNIEKINIYGVMMAILSLLLGFMLFSFKITTVVASDAATVASPYVYNFNSEGALNEIGSMSQSSSPYWWVDSGAYLEIYSGRGHTNEGNLSTTDPWRLIYSANNPVDTDNGYHPQNIFRLLTRSKWQNAREEAYFIITKDNLSSSPNRDNYNGILLFNRYQDQDNLYYTGIRVDGQVIIKKKQNGNYTTLAYTPNIYPGTYSRNANPSLLPKNKWIGLRSEVKNNPDGSVNIKLYIDKGWSGVWVLAAEATDRNNPITQAGYGGIRTDFMDVTFENFRFSTIF